MLKMIAMMIRFRVGQKVTRGAARKMGLGLISPLAGVIGGLKTMR